jgi:ABC-type bacteriocin/lantibiotic exporter with double-glycine peptidase domain
VKIYLELYFIKKYLKGNRWIIAAITGMLFVSLISAPVPYIIGYILDSVIISKESTKLLTFFILGLVVVYILKMLGTYLYQLCFVKTQQSVLNKMKIEIINNIMSAPLSFFDKNDRGYIGGRYSEVQQLAALFSPQVVGNLWGLLEIVFYIIIMVYINWKLTIGIIVIIPLYFVMSTVISKQIVKNSSVVNEVYSQFNSDIFETLNGIEDIKLLNTKELRSQKIERKIKEFSKASIKQSKIIISYIQSVIFTNDIISAAVLWICGIMIIRKTLSIGTYMSFTLYIAKILSNIQNLGALEMTVKPICVIIQRIKDYLYMDSEDEKINYDFNESIKSVEFKNVFFKYSKEKQYILNDFSCNLSCGDIVLLKGHNGSGKTTITKLFTGLYLPDKGEILINGKSINKISKKDLRNRIGIVTQDVFLFKGTVVENILLGSNDNKSRQDVTETVDKLELQKYINEFPQGLDSDILQNGDGISGGQKQIVAFLRAVIGHKDILILDEATSNLDKDTNKLLLNIIKQYRMAQIVLVITHQNGNMDFANKIVDLDNT